MTIDVAMRKRRKRREKSIVQFERKRSNSPEGQFSLLTKRDDTIIYRIVTVSLKSFHSLELYSEKTLSVIVR